MAKHGTAAVGAEHPGWCEFRYRGPDDHDAHTSPRERVAEDFPSDLSIEANLLCSNTPADPRYPGAALARLEFQFRGEKVASFLMTFGQLRRLDEALYRLVKLGETT